MTTINSNQSLIVSFENRHNKGKYFKTQLQTIFEYLQTNTATATMVSDATGVTQKNITRYKDTLQKQGKLWEVKKVSCKSTGYKANYLTTNPENKPKSNQLRIF